MYNNHNYVGSSLTHIMKQLTSSWPDGLTGRALQRHQRGQGSSHCSGLNFSGLSHYISSFKKLWGSYTIARHIFHYFVFCSENKQTSPFTQDINNTLKSSCESWRTKKNIYFRVRTESQILCKSLINRKSLTTLSPSSKIRLLPIIFNFSELQKHNIHSPINLFWMS